MDIKIQFLLFNDGISHKTLGLNVVYGLRNLGIRTEFFWPKRNIGSLLECPDYVFCLEPENDSLVKVFKKKGAKICLIVNEKVLSRVKQMIYDFAVAPTIELLSLYDIPTYSIKEEFDYYLYKKHTDTFKIVTIGNKEQLFMCLPEVLEKLQDLDITIISNFERGDKLPNIFYKFKLKKILVLDVFNEKHDEETIRQFLSYDAGFIIRFPFETSNRMKLLTYAGLPVVTNKIDNNENFDWKQELLKLKNKNIRQDISDENYSIIEKNYGIERSAKSFLRAISLYEKSKFSKFYIKT